MRSFQCTALLSTVYNAGGQRQSQPASLSTRYVSDVLDDQLSILGCVCVCAVGRRGLALVCPSARL